MEWIIIIVLALLMVFLFGGVSSKKKPTITSNNATNISAEAKEIADKVTTLKQFRALEKRLENADNRLSEVTTEKAYENACHKAEVLQNAVDIAHEKTYQWQLIPVLDLETPKDILDRAYKIYSTDEYNEIRNTIPDEFIEYWHEIDGDGEKEDPEPYLKPLIKFREIVESDEQKDVMVKKINQLVSKNKSLSDELFDKDSPLTPADQWFADELEQNGLPLAHELYSEGFTTPEKCLEIDLESFGSRKGVGPKRLEQLKQFQTKVRNEL